MRIHKLWQVLILCTVGYFAMAQQGPANNVPDPIGQALESSTDLQATIFQLIESGEDAGDVVAALAQRGQTPVQIAGFMVATDASAAQVGAALRGQFGLSAAEVRNTMMEGGSTVRQADEAMVAARATAVQTGPGQGIISDITGSGLFVTSNGLPLRLRTNEDMTSAVLAFVSSNPDSLNNSASQAGISLVLQNALGINSQNASTIISAMKNSNKTLEGLTDALYMAANEIDGDFYNRVLDIMARQGFGIIPSPSPAPSPPPATPTPVPTPTPYQA